MIHRSLLVIVEFGVPVRQGHIHRRVDVVEFQQNQIHCGAYPGGEFLAQIANAQCCPEHQTQ